MTGSRALTASRPRLFRARPRSASAALSLLLLAAGCSHDALVFATRSTVGLKITPTKNDQTEVSFAYDREEVAIFPVHVPAKDEEPDVYSVFSSFSLRNAWPLLDAWSGELSGGLRIQQHFATGCAAKTVTGVPCEEE